MSDLCSPTFAGLANYAEIMGDTVFWKALGNNAIMAAFGGWADRDDRQ